MSQEELYCTPFCEQARKRIAELDGVLKHLASFKYVGGGYFRKRGVPRGEAAETIHGSQVMEMIESALEGADE